MAKSFKKLVKKTSTAKSKKIAAKRTKELLADYKAQMIQRYGTQVNWVEVEMHLTYDEMVKYFGEQCEEYEPLCANCSNWVSWHKTGKANILFERDDLLKIM